MEDPAQVLAKAQDQAHLDQDLEKNLQDLRDHLKVMNGVKKKNQKELENKKKKPIQIKQKEQTYLKRSKDLSMEKALVEKEALAKEVKVKEVKVKEVKVEKVVLHLEEKDQKEKLKWRVQEK